MFLAWIKEEPDAPLDDIALVVDEIAQRASELRSALLREGRKLKTPDAQIAATAILYGVDMLHSLDPHLLNIHGSPAVDGLVIVKPRLLGGQRALPGFRLSLSDADQHNDPHDEPENAGGYQFDTVE